MPSKQGVPKLSSVSPPGIVSRSRRRSTKRPSTLPSLPHPPPATRSATTAPAARNPQLVAAVTADRYRRLSSALDAFLPSFTQLYLHRQAAGLASTDWLVVWAKLHEAAWMGLGLEDLARMGDGEFTGTAEKFGVKETWWVGLRECIMGYVERMDPERAEGAGNIEVMESVGI